jgi:Archaeal fructose-1,6-bisphosphatase and related enzymes of inositol monophosphatase family
MALVASGGADAYMEFNVHAWDMAAGAVLVTEAGGVVIDPAGKDKNRVEQSTIWLDGKVPFGESCPLNLLFRLFLCSDGVCVFHQP